MYDLRFEKDRWVIEVNKGGAFQGSLKEVMGYCIHYLEMEQSELDFALDEMIRRKHDAAHFGVMKSFISTFKTSERPSTRVGVTHGLH